MRKTLVILTLALCSAPAAAAAGAHCDATPFTLGKPTVAMPKASGDEPKSKPKAAPVAAKKPEAKPASKQRLLASCKAGKKKSG